MHVPSQEEGPRAGAQLAHKHDLAGRFHGVHTGTRITAHRARVVLLAGALSPQSREFPADPVSLPFSAPTSTFFQQGCFISYKCLTQRLLIFRSGAGVEGRQRFSLAPTAPPGRLTPATRQTLISNASELFPSSIPSGLMRLGRAWCRQPISQNRKPREATTQSLKFRQQVRVV